MRSKVALLALGLLALAPASAQAQIGVVSMRPLTLVEGERIPSNERVAVFSDTGACAPDAYVVSISWGDGTTSAGEVDNPQPIPAIGGGEDCTYAVVGDHAYANAGSYPVSAEVCRGLDCQTGLPRLATVAEAELRGEARSIGAAAGQAFAGQVAEFNDDNRFAQPGDYAAVIDWGDGTTSPGVVSGKDGRFVVDGQHVYATPGSYVLRVSLLRGGVTRAVSDPGTARVVAAGADTSKQVIVGTERITLTNRNALVVRTLGVRRGALSRGLPVRLTVPQATRSVRFTVARAARGARALGGVTVRVRGGRVGSDGMRVVNLRVRFAKALRAKLRPGSYVLRFRIGDAPQVTARFRVTR